MDWWKFVERAGFLVGIIIGAATLYFTAGLYYGWNEAPKPQRTPATPVISGHVMTAPWWLVALGVVAFVLIILSSVMLFVRLRAERRSKGEEDNLPNVIEPPASVMPDWPIGDLFRYLDPELSSRATADWDAVGSEVLDKFSTGQLVVWGRQIKRTATTDFLPLTKIDPSYWQKAIFSYAFLLDGRDRDKHASHYNGVTPDYGDLQVNEAQARSIWPNQEIPLREAARIAFESIEKTDAGSVIKSANGPDVIGYFVQSFLLNRVAMYGAQPPSTKRYLISEARGSLFWVTGTNDLKFASDKRAVYVDVIVPRKSLDGHIAYLRGLDGKN